MYSIFINKQSILEKVKEKKDFTKHNFNLNQIFSYSKTMKEK